jgi:ATP-binding cassette subfamily C protein
MINMILNSLSLINIKEKFFMFVIFVFMIFYSSLEFLSVGILVPLVSVLFGDVNSFSLVQNQYLSKFFNYFLSFKIENLLFLVVTFFFLKNILIFIFITTQNFIIFTIRKRIVHNLYQKYLNQDYASLTKLNTSEILRNISIAQNFSTVLISVLNIVLESLVLLSLSIFLILYNFEIAINIILIFGALLIIIYYFTKRKIFKWGQNSQDLDKSIKKNIYENIANIKEIKLYRRENFFLFLLSQLNYSLAIIDFKIDTFQQIPRFIIEITAVTLLCVIIFINLNISNNAEIIALLVAYSAVLFRLMPSTTRVSAALQRLKFYSSQVNILAKELKLKFVNKPTSIKYNDSFDIKSLKIININYRYNNASFLIKNLSLSFKKGTINCITGDNGSGKTTLINIILGLLKPKNGRLLINNSENLYKYFKYKYNKVGYVSQSTYLLDDSIKNNIIFGDSNVDMSSLEKAIKASQLSKLISILPNKLETLVGERGVKLSGGQVQKIAIARCLYRNPDFLVLDEFNNNLDMKSELKILNYLKEIKKDKIIIIISHKKEIYKYCDNVFFLNTKKLVKL